jgi:hypothetical protein
MSEAGLRESRPRYEYGSRTQAWLKQVLRMSGTKWQFMRFSRTLDDADRNTSESINYASSDSCGMDNSGHQQNESRSAVHLPFGHNNRDRPASFSGLSCFFLSLIITPS